MKEELQKKLDELRSKHAGIVRSVQQLDSTRNELINRGVEAQGAIKILEELLKDNEKRD